MYFSCRRRENRLELSSFICFSYSSRSFEYDRENDRQGDCISSIQKLTYYDQELAYYKKLVSLWFVASIYSANLQKLRLV